MKLLPFLHLLFFTAAFCTAFKTQAQEQVTISGYVKDAASGETLVGANVFVKQAVSQGTSTNLYGYYSLTIQQGAYQLVASFVGYQNQVFDVQLDADTSIMFELSEGVVMQEVTIKAEDPEEGIEGTQMGRVSLEMQQLERLPALLGEVDVLKAIQLLPGVSSAGEGNTGFYVRGGGADQNLVLLDEAVVYNSGHLLGFFSVFNADAIKNTTLIKGGLPAYYGGRLSSVVDVRMKDGNDKRYELSGGIGLLAARLTAEGPIIKEKSSFLVSARRTYAFDLAQPLIKGTSVEGTNYYFYDVNAKVNYRLGGKDRLFLSGYFGRDVLNYVSNQRGFSVRIPYGNATTTLRWNHLFGDKMFMNVSAIFNDYKFALSGRQTDFTAKLNSGVRDYNAKVDIDFYPSPKHQMKFGAHYTWHKLTPDIVEATSGDVVFTNELVPKFAHEAALYWQDDMRVNNKLALMLGLRYSWFAHVGPYNSPDEEETFRSGELIQDYQGLEPRATVRYRLSESASLKAGFTMAYQYLHLVSNSNTTLPFDVWVPSSRLVKPQLGLQYALGYFRNFNNNMYEASIEAYYRDLQNQIDYRDSYVNDPSTEVERNFVFGRGEAYGLELFVKKRSGALNGWLGYTLSRTQRSFPDIENGRTYPAVYDRTHDLSVVANYELSPKWNFGLVFVYGTGRAYTPIESVYLIEQQLNTKFGPRNSARLDAYHRIDLSATLTPKPNSDRPFTSSWTFSIYNTYSRLNPLFIYTTFDTDLQAGTAEATAYKVSLFPIIPSVTWNFSWKGS